MKRSIFIILAVFFSTLLFAQNDSIELQNSLSKNNYYSDYSKLLTLKPYVLFKLNTLSIHNQEDRLLLSPKSPTGVGLGLNYKFAGLSLGLGLPHSKSSIDKYGKTQRLDLQVSLFRKNIGLDGHFQLYKGYYNKNPQDFMIWEEEYYPKLPNMRTISFGASGYYVVNNKHYSNKAAVVRTQVQNRSAGSLLLGVFFNYDEANSPDGFFPKELPDTIATDFDLKAFRYIASGISVGYAFTWVISKNFFLNISAVPGGGYKYIRVVDNAGESGIERHVHAQILLRGAFGYEGQFFFAGITGSTLIRNIEYKKYELDLATEQLRLTIGRRFDVGRK